MTRRVISGSGVFGASAAVDGFVFDMV